MYLLRRRADGKFWKNKAISVWACSKSEQWTDNPSECKPFSTPGAAMKSRGASIPVGFTRPDEWTPESRTAYFRAQHEWYSQKNLPARKAAFNEKYEVVPVTIEVKV